MGVWIEIGRSFHQLGTVQEKVFESDLVPLWYGTTKRRSLAVRFKNYKSQRQIPEYMAEVRLLCQWCPGAHISENIKAYF